MFLCTLTISIFYVFRPFAFKVITDTREVGGEWAKQVICTEEDTCDDEHWVFSVSDESPNSTPETNSIC